MVNQFLYVTDLKNSKIILYILKLFLKHSELIWIVFCITEDVTGSGILGYFWGAVTASAYAEIMARIRKFPAITYLVISIFPLIPGAGVYYTMNYAVRGEMDRFASQGIYTAAIAGIMAVGILLVSTLVRVYHQWKIRK